MVDGYWTWQKIAADSHFRARFHRSPRLLKGAYYNAMVASFKGRILVTGGAGYIGSNTTLQLLDAGDDVVGVDGLTRGRGGAVDPARLRVVDLLDTNGLLGVMNEKPCQAVIHFAAFIAVGESMEVPE